MLQYLRLVGLALLLSMGVGSVGQAAEATFDQFVSSIRQEFGGQDAGKKFEVFCKWFLENDPDGSKTVDRVWLWDEYPNKWQ